MWAIECKGNQEVLEVFMQSLESFSKAISFFKEEDTPEWQLEALFEKQPDITSFKLQLESLASLCKVICPSLMMDELPDKDWLAENLQAFPPLHIGQFYIHGSHVKEKAPANSLPLQIDAATAFGTGEHPTTYGCLIALEVLHTFYMPATALDMGCGSGILSMAMAKLWPAINVLGVDNDLEAVRVSKENYRINKVNIQVNCIMSEGFKELNIHKPFELITANILAGPLIELAKELSTYLKKESFIILSGLLKYQVEEVLCAYQNQGLRLYKEYLRNDWATLTLQKTTYNDYNC